MAKKVKQEKPIEVSLWESANKLRGSVEPSEYKHVVLGLIFLKFVSDKFEKHQDKLIEDGKEKYIDIPEFYNMSNVFYLKETSRWSYIRGKAKQDDLALIIDTALHTIEKDNKSLKGALPDNYFSRLGLESLKLASLIDEISEINILKDKEQDVVGPKAANTFLDDQHKDFSLVPSKYIQFVNRDENLDFDEKMKTLQPTIRGRRKTEIRGKSCV